MGTITSTKNDSNLTMPGYFLYVLECDNGSYYTGYTKNLARRYAEHRNGTAKSSYTRSFRPIRIAQCWHLDDSIGVVLRIERWIKQQSKATKILLIQRPDQLKAMVEKKLKIEVNIMPFNWSDIDQK